MRQAAGTPIVGDGLVLPDRGRTGGVERALRLVRARLAEDPLARPDLAGMAAAAGVSARSLQRHFAKLLGLSPRAAVLRLRLAAARRTLAGGDAPSVLAAALRHGFDHPGRFAIAYRNTFGEAPSATLRLGRMQPAGSTLATGTVIDLHPLAPDTARDAAQARRVTETLAIAITRARGLVLAAPGASDAGRLRLEGRVEGREAVLSLLHPASGSVVWMARRRLRPPGWADAVAGALAAAITLRRIDQARRTPRHRADAETLFLRARPAALIREHGATLLALDLLEEALHRDPGHAGALALAGWTRAQGANHGFWPDPDAVRAQAVIQGQRALALAPDDPDVLMLAAGVMSLTHRLEEAELLLCGALIAGYQKMECARIQWRGWFCFAAVLLVTFFVILLSLVPLSASGWGLILDFWMKIRFHLWGSA